MATYAQDYALANTTTFQQQVEMSVVKAAVAIATEARTVHPTLDSKRHALAVTVLNAPSNASVLTPFYFACVETGLSGTPTDAQVDTAVSSVWNGIAGVSAQDSA